MMLPSRQITRTATSNAVTIQSPTLGNLPNFSDIGSRTKSPSSTDATNAGELTAYRWDADCRRRKLAIDFSHLVSITYQGRLCMVLCSALNCTKTSTNTAIIIASEVVVFIDFGVRRLLAKLE